MLTRIDARTMGTALGALALTIVLGAGTLQLTSGWTLPPSISKTIPIPQMVELPGGTFQMGSPPDEPFREENELLHEVTVAPFAIARTEVTVRQFRAFVEETGYDASDGCFRRDETTSEWNLDPEANWDNPGFFPVRRASGDLRDLE